MTMSDRSFSRRQLLLGGAAAATGAVLVGGRGAEAGVVRRAPALLRADRPRLTHGVQSGDVLGERAIVWGKADRASRMWVEVATSERGEFRRVRGPVVEASSAFTGKVDPEGLRPGQRHVYRVRPDWGGTRCFETMSAVEPDLFLFSGDCIYADGPLRPEVKNAAGEVIWRNLVTPEKSKVAETLDEYRGNFLLEPGVP